MSAYLARATRDQVAEYIRRAVGDPELAEAIVAKVANACVDGLISRGDLAVKLEIISNKRKRGLLVSPAAYFNTCAQELFLPRRGGMAKAARPAAGLNRDRTQF